MAGTTGSAGDERGGGGFLATQHAHFSEADDEHFRWVTSAPGFAETEDQLLAPMVADLVAPCLEVGCGEGGNLARLMRAGACVGVDLHASRARFAARALPGVRTAAADAARLPFADAAFRTVFVRDLLHHVSDPGVCLSEAVRVLAPGGRLWLLEPNGRNPLVWLHSCLVSAEAEAGRSGVARVQGYLEPLPLVEVSVRTLQPLPLRRLLLHHRFGLPALARPALLRGVLRGVERALGGLLPASRWAYVVAEARRMPA